MSRKVYKCSLLSSKYDDVNQSKNVALEEGLGSWSIAHVDLDVDSFEQYAKLMFHVGVLPMRMLLCLVGLTGL